MHIYKHLDKVCNCNIRPSTVCSPTQCYPIQQSNPIKRQMQSQSLSIPNTGPWSPHGRRNSGRLPLSIFPIAATTATTSSSSTWNRSIATSRRPTPGCPAPCTPRSSHLSHLRRNCRCRRPSRGWSHCSRLHISPSPVTAHTAARDGQYDNTSNHRA